MSKYVKQIRKAFGNKGAVLNVGRKIAKVAQDGSSLIDLVSRSGIVSPEVANKISTINNSILSVANAARENTTVQAAITAGRDIASAADTWGKAVSKIRKGKHGDLVTTAGRLMMSTLQNSVSSAITKYSETGATTFLNLEAVRKLEEAEVRYERTVSNSDAESFEAMFGAALTSDTFDVVNGLGASHALDTAISYWGRLAIATPVSNDGEIFKADKEVWHIPGNSSGSSIRYEAGASALAGGSNVVVRDGADITFENTTGDISLIEPSDGAIAAIDALQLRMDGVDALGRNFPPDPNFYRTVAKMLFKFYINTTGGNMQTIIGAGVGSEIEVVLFGGLDGEAKELSRRKISYLSKAGTSLSAIAFDLVAEVPMLGVGEYDFDYIVKANTQATGGTVEFRVTPYLVGWLAVPISDSMSIVDVGYIDETEQYEKIDTKTRWSDLFARVNVDSTMLAEVDPNKNVGSMWRKWVAGPEARTLELVFEFIRLQAPDVDQSCIDQLGVPNGLMDLAAVSRWIEVGGPMSGVTDFEAVMRAGLNLLTTLASVVEQSNSVAQALSKHIVAFRTV